MDRKESDAVRKDASISFAERLRDARTDKGLSRPELGFKTGIRHELLEFYENRPANLPRCLNLILLADVLGVTTDWLLGRDGGA